MIGIYNHDDHDDHDDHLRHDDLAEHDDHDDHDDHDNDNHGDHDDLPDHMTREGYRLTKVSFVHVYPQIPLLWSNVRLLV